MIVKFSHFIRTNIRNLNKLNTTAFRLIHLIYMNLRGYLLSLAISRIKVQLPVYLIDTQAIFIKYWPGPHKQGGWLQIHKHFKNFKFSVYIDSYRHLNTKSETLPKFGNPLLIFGPKFLSNRGFMDN